MRFLRIYEKFFVIYYFNKIKGFLVFKKVSIKREKDENCRIEIKIIVAVLGLIKNASKIFRQAIEFLKGGGAFELIRLTKM